MLTGIKGLLQSKKGVTGILTAMMNVAVGLGLVWANKPDLIPNMAVLITTLGGILIGSYAVQDFGKEAAKFKNRRPGDGIVWKSDKEMDKEKE